MQNQIDDNVGPTNHPALPPFSNSQAAPQSMMNQLLNINQLRQQLQKST
jgi:hypothetical protein